MKGLGATRILLTCHGFDSQFLEKPDKLALCGLDPSRLHQPDRLQDNINADLVNVLKVGCLLSDFLDVDLENLKTLVWMALRKGVQVENVRFLSKYDEASSHLIFAGSDIILCPTFDDPVLQLPLKAMKYGAAPVAVNFEENRFRHVGDHEFEVTKLSQYISSTFANMSLIKAVDEVKNNPSEWNRKIMDAMSMDFSWEGECCDIHLSAYASIKDL